MTKPDQVQLNKMTDAGRLAIAVRVALRFAPLLAYQHDIRPHGEQSIFGGLDADDAGELVSAYFQAIKIATLGTVKHTAAVKQAASAAVKAGSGIRPLKPAANAAFCAAISAAKAASIDAQNLSFINEVMSFVDDAARHARLDATASRAATEAANADVEKIQNNISIPRILSTPLWPDGMPDQLTVFWDKLYKDCLKMDNRFELLLKWYRERYNGNSYNEDDETKKALLSDAILAQGATGINTYLERRIENYPHKTIPLDQVRVIFLGHPEAGKSSLIRAMCKQDVYEGSEKQTRGVKVTSDASVPISRLRGGKDYGAKVYFWDFGGQVIMHHTHQFFLRSNCIYVIVLSARVDTDINLQALYWLEHIRAFGGASPILIVGNKLDLGRAGLNIKLRELKKRFPNIVGYFPLTSLSDLNKSDPYKDNLIKFLDELHNQIDIMIQRSVKLFPNEHAILESLRNKSYKDSFLEFDRVERICSTHDVTEKLRQTLLLETFDNLGLMLHFPEVRTYEARLLNPELLTRGVYAIINSKELGIKKGRIRTTEFVNLLLHTETCDVDGNKLDFDREKAEFVLNTMECFNLCFHPPSRPDEIIVPDLLDEEEPQHTFNFKGALAFRFRFDGFIPRHILHTLIVVHHGEICDDKVWQSGAHLKPSCYAPGTEALLKSDYEETRTLQISVNGPQAKEYLGVLIEDLKGFALRKFKLEPIEEIELTAEMRIDETASAGSEWAPYRQVRSHIKTYPGSPFIGPDGLIYNLKSIETRLPPGPEAVTLVRAIDEILKTLQAQSASIEDIRRLQEVKVAAANADAVSAEKRQSAGKTLKALWEGWAEIARQYRNYGDIAEAISKLPDHIQRVLTAIGLF